MIWLGKISTDPDQLHQKSHGTISKLQRLDKLAAVLIKLKVEKSQMSVSFTIYISKAENIWSNFIKCIFGEQLFLSLSPFLNRYYLIIILHNRYIMKCYAMNILDHEISGIPLWVKHPGPYAEKMRIATKGI